jgi:hypothetical protein
MSSAASAPVEAEVIAAATAAARKQNRAEKTEENRFFMVNILGVFSEGALGFER